MAVIAIALAAFVATTSLAVALAESHPKFALWLSPGNPKALLALARQDRTQLLEAQKTPIPGLEAAEDQERSTARAVAETTWPDVASQPRPAPEQLKQHILTLAKKAVKSAPLNAEAVRMLGETVAEQGLARQFMLDALARSRRETIATFWLLNQAYAVGNLDVMGRMADLLLVTRRSLTQYVTAYLNTMVLTSEGRAKLADILAQKPAWRGSFIGALSKNFPSSDAPLALFLLMKERGDVPTDVELSPYLAASMRTSGSATAAYNVWLQLLPEERLARLEAYRNFNFADDPSGLPFDWSLPRSGNVAIELRKKPNEQGRLLGLRFGVGRVSFPGISQTMFLVPGKYVLEGKQSGRMVARRGMRWRITCIPGSKTLTETDQLMGAIRDWRLFRLEFEVPDTPQCEAQLLRLVHDARSPSEQYASGDILFDGLRIVRQ